MQRLIYCFITCFYSAVAHSSDLPDCGDEGVWVQTLGSGGLELDNERAAGAYLVWVNNRARVLIDAGSGTTLRYDESGADFTDLDAILLSNLQINRSGDLASLIAGSKNLGRERLLPILGPVASSVNVSTKLHIERLMGPEGAFSHLAEFLTFGNPGGYKISVREVPAKGNRVWSRFNNRDMKISAIPIHHADIPTLAWRIEVDNKSIVFAGGFSNLKDVVAKFALDSDLLVVTHAIPEGTRGTARDKYVVPSQIGRIAAAANARILLLGGRHSRTQGVESISQKAIESIYEGALIFGGELECWGL